MFHTVLRTSLLTLPQTWLNRFGCGMYCPTTALRVRRRTNDRPGVTTRTQDKESLDEPADYGI